MSDETTKREELQEVGQCAYESIVDMVAALQCDYDRLKELRTERGDFDGDGYDSDVWEEVFPDDAEELRELEADAGDCEDEDDARERIMDDPLSLQVRSDWHAPGAEMEAEEFELLLATGGPAVRIIGTLGGFGEPETATLQVQNWFTPWTDYVGADEDVLLAYCHQFYYGE